MEYIFLFTFGLIIGSFLNVVILRYDPDRPILGKQLGGRSHCMSCGKLLHWYELFPVFSWIVQFGRCRGCKKWISFQYPIVELSSALIFASVPYMLGFNWFAPFWIIALLALLVASVIDLRHYLIPDETVIAIALSGIVVTFLEYFKYIDRVSLVPGSFVKGYAYMVSFTDNILLAHLSSALILGGFFAAIIIFTRGKGMGWGDAKLAAALGLLLGWPDSALAIALSFIIGMFFGIALMVFHLKKFKDMIPFGPFIALGAVIIIFWGYPLVESYFHLINVFF